MANVTESILDHPGSEEVKRWTIQFPGRLEATVMSYGATLMDLKVPDREGKLQTIVLGYDRLEDYQQDNRNFGNTIGRFANRIANGKFTLDGTEYTLPVNNGPHTLHGGPNGFDKQIWQIGEVHTGDDEVRLRFTYHSKDGEQGFPGNLQVRVTYIFGPDSMKITYEAETDQKTPVNLTHHSYFNLSGDMSSPITDHTLWLRASCYLPIDDTGIPLAEAPAPVQGSPFDFREAHRVGEKIDHPALSETEGYDHCFVLDPTGMDTVCARIQHTGSGRQVEVRTTEPGIQFFSGNFLPSEKLYEGGRHFGRYSGLALETQHLPDSPNRPDFPSTILSPGNRYHSETLYSFLVMEE
ncbi:MAG: aldose epimerase family protein [Cyclobacteriaceae bacterium]